MESNIELLHAFDFSDYPNASFASARETPWRDGLPFGKGLRAAVEHLQEMDGGLPHSDWRCGVYRFQIDLVQRGYLQSFHLETGNAITTRLSFPAGGDVVLNPIFYRFDDPELHYIIIGFHPPRMVGIFFPERKQVMSLMNHDHPIIRQGWDPDRIALSCVMLEELLQVNADAVDQYCASADSHRLVLTQAFRPNVGHQLREEFSLLWKLYTKTDCEAALLTGPFDVLELARQLPDTIPRERVTFDESEVPWPVNYFNAVVNRGLFLSRMGCRSHMPLEMQHALQAGFRTEHPEAFDEIQKKLKNCWPVVWLTLREHNRKWIGEGFHLRRLAETVTAKYPKAGFILDGLPDVRESADEILASQATVIDFIGSRFTEAQACFHLADAYVMPYSNSCTLHMVNPRPGVVHGLKGWIPDEPFEPAATESPVMARVVHGVKCETGNESYDAWVTTCDYQLDSEPVISALLEVLAELAERVSTS